MTKFCKDCRYSINRKCNHPTVNGATLNLVTGEIDVILHSCGSLRYDKGSSVSDWYYYGKCGPDAVLFQPKYTFKEKFMARLKWWTGQDYDAGALK